MSGIPIGFVGAVPVAGAARTASFFSVAGSRRPACPSEHWTKSGDARSKTSMFTDPPLRVVESVLAGDDVVSKTIQRRCGVPVLRNRSLRVVHQLLSDFFRALKTK